MRTTLSLDDDVIEIVKDYAAVKNLSLGGAVSDLVRKGIAAPLRTKVVNGLTIFDPPPDSPVVTAQQVEALKAEL
jgi:hypothetical protein